MPVLQKIEAFVDSDEFFLWKVGVSNFFYTLSKEIFWVTVTCLLLIVLVFVEAKRFLSWLFVLNRD